MLKELNNLNIRLTRCQCGRKSAAAVWACCSCRGVGVILFVNPRNLRNLSAAVAAGQVWVCRRGDRDWDTETVSQSVPGPPAAEAATCSVAIHSKRVISDYSEHKGDWSFCDCCGQPGAGRRDAVIFIYCTAELLQK